LLKVSRLMLKLRDTPRAAAMAHIQRLSIGMMTDEAMRIRWSIFVKTIIIPASEAKAACVVSTL
jgi:hypothetical protein